MWRLERRDSGPRQNRRGGLRAAYHLEVLEDGVTASMRQHSLRRSESLPSDSSENHYIVTEGRCSTGSGHEPKCKRLGVR